MKKKRNAIQSIRSERVALQERAWHNGGDIELHLNARSLRRAVKTLKHRFDEVRANGNEYKQDKTIATSSRKER